MGRCLQFCIDRQRDLVPALPRLARQFADRPAIGVDLHLAGAGHAAQRLVAGLFDAALADLETGKGKDRIVVAEFILIDRTDIADKMSRLVR